MPRDIGTGIYSYPDGTPGNPGQTIFSARYNTFIDDLKNTLNQKLPINMGGTGADDAAEVRDNIKAEVRGVQVTNYNTHVFESGSFYSNPGANGAPGADPATDYFQGICMSAVGAVTIEVYNLSPITNPKPHWVRHFVGGSWSAWVQAESDRFVELTGDTMTGDLSIAKAYPRITLNKAASGQSSDLVGSTNGVSHWAVTLGDASTETGATGGVGSDLVIDRYGNDGAYLGRPLTINRATGKTVITGPLQVGTLPVALNVPYGNQLVTENVGSGYSISLNAYSGGGDWKGILTGTPSFQFYVDASGMQMRGTSGNVTAGVTPIWGPTWLFNKTGVFSSPYGITSGAIQATGPIGATGAITTTGAVNCAGMSSTSDITVQRAPSAPTTGYIYYGNSGTKYIGFDGVTLLASTNFYITGVLTAASRAMITSCVEVSGGGGWFFGLQAIPGSFYIGQSNGAGALVTNYARWDNPGNMVNYGAAYKPGGGAWLDSSDVRIKNVTGEFKGGLDEVLKLNPVRFTFKGNDTQSGETPSTKAVPTEEDGPETKQGLTAPYANSPHYQPAQSGQEFIGLIAQATEVAFPEMVTRRAGQIDGVEVTDLRDIDTTPLIFALVNAVKTLSARIEALEATQAPP